MAHKRKALVDIQVDPSATSFKRSKLKLEAESENKLIQSNLNPFKRTKVKAGFESQSDINKKAKLDQENLETGDPCQNSEPSSDEEQKMSQDF